MCHCYTLTLIVTAVHGTLKIDVTASHNILYAYVNITFHYYNKALAVRQLYAHKTVT